MISRRNKTSSYHLSRGLWHALIRMFIFGVAVSLVAFLGKLLSPVPLIFAILAVFTVAAAFQPALSRLQSKVDREFFRARYDTFCDLRRFARETEGVTDLKQLSSSLVTTIAHAMQSRSIYLMLPSSPAGGLEIYAHYGENSRARFSLSATSRLMLAMKYWDNIISSNDKDIPNIMGDADQNTLATNKIELLMPIRTEQQLVGLLLIGNRLSGKYSSQDVELLCRVVSQVAPGIERAYTYESLQTKNLASKKVADGVLHAMSLAIEMRDPYTAAHQRRVANLACGIAREMGLSGWDIEGIRVMALLHDVGKISVPAEILSKSGQISPQEFEVVKTHARAGYEILNGIDFPWPAIPQAVLQHHEKLNGSGYPDGLSGKDIILEAKILAVADVVEAMSSHRPYRPALSLDSVIEEISLKKGTLYDSEVVDACLRLLQRNKVEKLLISG